MKIPSLTFTKADNYADTGNMLLIKTEEIEVPDPEISPLVKLEARVKELERATRLPD